MTPGHDDDEGFWFVTRLPWVVPGVLITLVLSVACSGVVARWMRLPRALGWLLLFSTGVILSGTLTPLGPDYRAGPDADRSCDFSRIGLAPLAEIAKPTDVLLNILMFIPLGFAISVAPWSFRKAAILLVALALPILIESIQLVVSPIARGCQTADVADNLTGLVIGFLAGVLASSIHDTVARKDSSP